MVFGYGAGAVGVRGCGPGCTSLLIGPVVIAGRC